MEDYIDNLILIAEQLKNTNLMLLPRFLFRKWIHLLFCSRIPVSGKGLVDLSFTEYLKILWNAHLAWIVALVECVSSLLDKEKNL